MKKLSELPNETLLAVKYVTYDFTIMTKKDFINSFPHEKNNLPDVYLAIEVLATFDLIDTLECLSDDQYEGWYEDIVDNFSKEEIQEIEGKINSKLHARPSYEMGESVEIDVKY